MEIDWAEVKKLTLWSYAELIKKLLNVLDYEFVQIYYNYNMREAVGYAEKVQQGYLQNGKEAAFIGDIISSFQQLETLGVIDYTDLIQRVGSKEKCEAFINETGFPFDKLLQILNYLFRWVFPFRIPTKELVDTFSVVDPGYPDILKKQKLRSNLDILENFRSRITRRTFTKHTGIAESFLLELSNRADISRLAYVRGKTIKHLCGGGYNTLDKIANADIKQMEADMTVYYRSIGKNFSDFKAVIPLDWMIGGAGILPRLLEV